MNSHGLTRENIVGALPGALREDPSAVALAEAVAQALEDRVGEIDRLRLYPEIDRLDGEILDILARDFKIDWWNPDYSVEVKRALFRDNWRVHRLLGTPEAVNLVIRAVFGGGRMVDWYDYGGEPHHFKVEADNTIGVQEDWNTYFMRLLRYVKRLTSWLDGITVVTHLPEDQANVGGAMAQVTRLFVPEGGD